MSRESLVFPGMRCDLLSPDRTMTADDREDVRHVPARFRAAPFFPLLAGLVVIFVFSFGVTCSRASSAKPATG